MNAKWFDKKRDWKIYNFLGALFTLSHSHVDIFWNKFDLFWLQLTDMVIILCYVSFLKFNITLHQQDDFVYLPCCSISTAHCHNKAANDIDFKYNFFVINFNRVNSKVNETEWERKIFVGGIITCPLMITCSIVFDVWSHLWQMINDCCSCQNIFLSFFCCVKHH
jgi:hypothetical protein